MVPLVTDEDFKEPIVKGLRRREPALNIVGVRQSGLQSSKDPRVLDWAAGEKRVLLTHDIKTMVGHANDRVLAGLPMPGVIAVRQTCPIGVAIEDILTILTALTPAELDGQILYVPL